MFHHLCAYVSLSIRIVPRPVRREIHILFFYVPTVCSNSVLAATVCFFQFAYAPVFMCAHIKRIYNIIWYNIVFFSFKRFFEHGVRFLSPHTHVHTIDTVIRFFPVHNIEAETFQGAKEGDNTTFRILYYEFIVYHCSRLWQTLCMNIIVEVPTTTYIAVTFYSISMRVCRPFYSSYINVYIVTNNESH